MISDIDPISASRWVVGGGLLLGVALGAVGQATRFCVRGALADWVIFRGPARLVSWLLAIAVAGLSVQALISLGLFEPSRTAAWSNRFLWASYLVGGGLFGYGMILADGCPQRSLVKAGAGNLKALVTLVIFAIAALMTLRGAFSGLRTNMLDSLGWALSGPQDLGSLLSGFSGLAPQALRWGLVVGTAGAVLAFAWRVRRVLDPAHWIGGVLVGLLVAAAFFLTGNIGFVQEHPETLEPAWMGTQSRRPEGLSFSAPLAHVLDLLTLWSDRGTVATFGVMLALGVLAGSFLAAKVRGEFRVESFRTPEELGSHVAGGLLMGFGGITAIGCSIGNGVTGVALLSAGSLLATGGIVGGALLALGRQSRQEAMADGAEKAVPSS